VTVHGHVAAGFEQVRDAFERNFTERKELGAACAVYLRGEKVVDLWGGVRDEATGAPWEEDTMVVVFSTTKGMSAIALAVAHARGLFDYDAPVAKYWPEFAAHGKDTITVRALLSHQAGLCAVDEPLDVVALGDLDRVARACAAQKPAWKPGDKHGYHGITLGFYEGELVRRVDPKKRSLGQFFRDEVATPLGIDFHIGLPPSVPRERVANIKGFGLLELPLHIHTMPWRFVLGMFNPHSLTKRAFDNPRLKNPADIDALPFRAIEMPASNGIGTARAVARAYSALALGGDELGVKTPTLDTLKKHAPSPRLGHHDVVLGVETFYSTGFLKPSAMCRFGTSSTSFGTPGAGGSFGFADPDIGVGFAYVMNRMGFHIADDPREKALRDATYRCIAR
jgi:CubicO group peptidase (beta-lactamase class C family)